MLAIAFCNAVIKAVCVSNYALVTLVDANVNVVVYEPSTSKTEGAGEIGFD